MSAFDVTTVLEALRTQLVDKNGMLLQYEVPQPVYKTVGVRTFRDERADDKTEESIIGYSVYSGKNAGGSYKRVVAHKDQSHVMHIIAVKTSVKMDDKMTKALTEHFTVTELLDNGGAEGMAGRLLMDYIGKPVTGPKSNAFESFLDMNADLAESWLPLLTITPYLSKFNAHEMLAIGKHETIDDAIKAHQNLSSTYLF